MSGPAPIIDKLVEKESGDFDIISHKILGQGADCKYYEGGNRFNLHKFWSEHKEVLPVHYAVYVADVGCKKSAAANVEDVFSGACRVRYGQTG